MQPKYTPIQEIHLPPFVFFVEFTKIHVYILEPFENGFNNPFPIITINCGGDHHSPQRKRRDTRIKESGHLFILILHCFDIGKIFDNEKKEK